MRINLLLKITLVAFVLLGLSLRSAVSAGGSDEEVFPPKTLEKLKKNYSTQQKKIKSDSAQTGSKKSGGSSVKGKDELASGKTKDKSPDSDQTPTERSGNSGSVMEDEPLIADLTSIIDKDGIGEVNVVWKLSNDGSSYRTIPGATNQSFTPRQEHVGKTLRVLPTCSCLGVND